MGAAIAVYTLIDGLDGVARALGGPSGFVVLGMTLASPVWAGRNPARLAWLASSLLGLLAWLSLPGDWMGEFRFATPFLLITTVWATAELGPAVARVRAQRIRLALSGLGVVACLLLVGRDVSHALEYRLHPALPFNSVEQHFRITFTRWSADLELEDPEALVPDVGGALWARTVRVRDLVGLCDKRIARIRGDSAEMRQFILEELEPAFIRIHGPGPRDPDFLATRVSRPTTCVSSRSERRAPATSSGESW